ncbi:MAG: hypothetical protein JHC26_02465 [Thermofilum sp.]|jgi:transposase-like protein|uniref:hypothetical protein n=1 Tax=Thermofilum sp. TaxID=1961369 RepID=UPI0014292289|nr:hypothetical protein [Thermofilum sp.]MCI4407928.1 hypothetical protein [Thermofilum sp.]NAZ25272.1 hypothetical protein [Thermofilum sp.]
MGEREIPNKEDDGEEDIKIEVSQKRGILVCPFCGSADLVLLGVAGLTPPLYLCRKCGRTTYTPLEIFPENDTKESGT